MSTKEGEEGIRHQRGSQKNSLISCPVESLLYNLSLRAKRSNRRADEIASLHCVTYALRARFGYAMTYSNCSTGHDITLHQLAISIEGRSGNLSLMEKAVALPQA